MSAQTRSPTGAIAIEELILSSDGTGYRAPPRSRSLALTHSWGPGLARLPLLGALLFGGVAAVFSWVATLLPSGGVMVFAIFALPLALAALTMMRHGLRYLLDRTRIVLDGRTLVVRTIAFPSVRTRRIDLGSVRGFSVERRDTGVGSSAFTRFAVVADDAGTPVELISELLREEDARAIADALEPLLPRLATEPAARVEIDDTGEDDADEDAAPPGRAPRGQSQS